MISAARILMFASIVLTGCGTVENAAVTTFRVVDAPAHYVRERIDSSHTTTTTTTTPAGTSDVVTPGQPVNPHLGTPPAGSARVVESSSTQRTSPTATEAPNQRKSSSSTSTQKTVDVPTARPVPGKPGYVYSIDPQGGIVDVTGYKSGDKARDPYSKQVFIVP